MSLRSSLAETPAEDVAQLIALNFQATTILAGAAARAFPIRAPAAFVNISSVLALAPKLFEGVYSGSNAYLLNLRLSLAAQLREKAAHVQAVFPSVAVQ